MMNSETYTGLLDARDKLCAYCDSAECEKCQVTILIDDAYTEAEEAGIIEDI